MVTKDSLPLATHILTGGKIKNLQFFLSSYFCLKSALSNVFFPIFLPLKIFYCTTCYCIDDVIRINYVITKNNYAKMLNMCRPTFLVSGNIIAWFYQSVWRGPYVSSLAMYEVLSICVGSSEYEEVLNITIVYPEIVGLYLH